jgi:hypothetical protein
MKSWQALCQQRPDSAPFRKWALKSSAIFSAVETAVFSRLLLASLQGSLQTRWRKTGIRV